jgi:hypothetical protein
MNDLSNKVSHGAVAALGGLSESLSDGGERWERVGQQFLAEKQKSGYARPMTNPFLPAAQNREQPSQRFWGKRAREIYLSENPA